MIDLCEAYPEFFEFPKLNLKGKGVYDEVCFCSIDAEWHEEGGRNNVLSYQIATATKSTANNIILFMEPGERMRLVDLVEAGIKSVSGGDLPPFRPRKRILVILVCHNTTAEWSALADRDAPYITESIMVIRKTPVTGSRAIKVNLSDSTPVDVRIFDTMHLAPAGFKDLKTLSTLLGDKSLEKDDISQFHKENMDVFLCEEREEFIRYALRDTEVTLRLFFLLQKLLNELAYGETRQLFRTLGAAAVECFLEASPWFKGYRNALRRPDFWKANRIAERAYHGGRNEAFFVGKSADYPHTRNKVWVDIDFSGCYPTAMAACPKIDTEEA